MENSKRKEFIGKIAADVKAISDSKEKFYKETERMKPTIGELADGYRGFISDLGGGFLELIENYNMCLEIAKNNELIGDVKLKARIKDFSSSRINSDKKILDDVFGAEIVTATDTEKEMLMLFNHIVFDVFKDKKYNRPTGYNAYHCMGDFSIKEGNLKDIIKNTISETKTEQYRRSKTDPEFDKEKDIKEVSAFPRLKKLVKENPKSLDEMEKIFEEMIEYMNTTNTEMALPTVEFQFKTAEVEENALRGAAAHTKYKPNDEEMIKNKFRNGQLIRGINSPWKFKGTNAGLKLQDFYDTLMENWPFLKDTIVERRNAGKEQKDRVKSAQFDNLTASQFPFLRKYIPRYNYDESKKEEKWGVLKVIMIVNRLDETKPLEDELLAQIKNLWGNDSESKDENGGPSL